MSGPNHIVGGIAITGISLSFWDINIFSSATYLSLCVFSSLLPDIDHTKSIIGKMFFPLARYLDRNFGHRTITHSLSFMLPLFLFFLFIELNLINPYFERKGLDYSLIFFFGFLSHLILDMLTIQGIPLFYPFLKNPCVIPANPNLRFRSGNPKSEAIALFIFTFVLFTSFDLFKNGFWTTYNRSFGTIKHVYREFKDSEKIILVSYEYSFNGKEKKGDGYVLDASEHAINLLIKKDDFKRILTIDSKDLRFKNVSVKPSKTDFTYSVKDFTFFNLTIEEINDTLKNKIVSGKILSSAKFIVNQHRAEKGSIELKKEISPQFKWLKNDTLKKSIANKIELKKAKLNQIRNDNFKELEKHNLLKITLKKYKSNLNSATDIYQKNKFEKLIIQQKKKIADFKIKVKNVALLTKEITLLEKELNYNKTHFFTGDLKIFEF